jgi:hypothetical protein
MMNPHLHRLTSDSMQKRPLNKAETAQSAKLLADLGETLVRSGDELGITSVGVVTTALCSLLLGGISSSVSPEQWEETLDILFGNMKQIMKTHKDFVEHTNNAEFRIN